MTEPPSLKPLLELIEQFVNELEQSTELQTRDTAIELVQLVMELHRSGLERLLKVVTRQIAVSEGSLLRLAEDDLVSALLLLHGLHPVDLTTRVNRALEKVRPYLRSHNGNVELLEIEEGYVRLRLQGSCHGCPSSTMTLKLAIEDALYEFAPDIAGLEVEGVVPPHAAGFIPVEALSLPSTPRTSEVAALTDSNWDDVSKVAVSS